MSNPNICCLTGHRKLPKEAVGRILLCLDCAVEALIARGVTTFLCGGALGFDQMAASLIVAKKELGKNVKLIFALPCKNQDEFWSREQKKLYRNLLSEADGVIYVSEQYDEGCMERRNRYLVDHSAYCVCALLHPLSGTGATVAYARKQGLTIINTAE